MKNVKRSSGILGIFLIIAMLFPGITEAAPLDGEVKRLDGLNRIETAVNVSKESYKDEEADAVVLAGYSGSADALAASLLASDLDAPLLLAPAPGGKLSDELEDEIERLAAKKAYILGGPAAISKSTESEIKELGLKVERLSGSNRYKTAVTIAEKAEEKDEIFLALGKNMRDNGEEDALADALSIGPVSGKEKMPVLLTGKGRLPEASKKAIKDFGVKKVTIVGGELAVSPKVEEKLENMGIQVDRIAGLNRYDTAIKIAERYFEEAENTIIANGIKDTDALVGGYLGALYNQPMLLTQAEKLTSETKEYIRKHSQGSYVLGGKAVILNSVLKEIKSANNEDEENQTDLAAHFIDVGQGDSILIKEKEKTILIDAGERWEGENVVNYLKEENVNKIDYLIGTHPHSDHIGGLKEVVKQFDIGKIIMPKVGHTSQAYENLLVAIEEKGLKISSPVVGDEYSLDKAHFTILAPNANQYSNLNEYSVAIKLEHGNNSFVLTGDAEAQSEKEMLGNGLDLTADLLKLGHHGSDTSTSVDFLDRVDPQYAVIQVGENNQYGHPAQTVLGRLEKRKIKTYRNDIDGNIVAKSDGENIRFSPREPGKVEVPEEDPEDGGEADESTKVIKTKTGSKYHRPGCPTLRSEIETTLKEAKEIGLKPCKVCKPAK